MTENQLYKELAILNIDKAIERLQGIKVKINHGHYTDYCKHIINICDEIVGGLPQ